MSGRLLRSVLLVGLLTGSAGCAADRGGDFEAGMAAMLNGDYAEAYCRWKPLAERGHVEAQYNLGWLYANGNGMRVSIERALEWWMKAAAQGYGDAQFAVALAYTTGEGMRPDLDEAVRWYLMAARQGHGDAREILLRLNGDPSVSLIEDHPELAREPWFGWTARVEGERINVRGGPGTEHPVVAQLEQATPVRVVGERGDWYMVILPAEAQSRMAWVYKPLVRAVDG
jgi:TPR repeat protein